MYILNLVDEITKFMKPVHRWIENNYNNPVFWIGIVLIALIIFGISYSFLHKGE